MGEKKLREILPAQGIWTVEDLAGYLGVTSATVQQKLSEAGITVLSFSHRYKHRLFRLEERNQRCHQKRRRFSLSDSQGFGDHMGKPLQVFA